jgi:hypothetical protein
MARLDRLTGGKALRAYQAILVSNARLAAQIGTHLAASAVPEATEGMGDRPGAT